MPSVQSPCEIDDLLAVQLTGRSIRQLQVLGINSLKTVSPSADELVGEHVRSARCEGRVIAIATTACEIRVDLQRIGRVTWLENADAWQLSSGVPLPTARLLLDDGSGLDFTESPKTKRITVSVLPGSVQRA
jgi:formamidopyrimidine-DNA glycosylase